MHDALRIRTLTGAAGGNDTTGENKHAFDASMRRYAGIVGSDLAFKSKFGTFLVQPSVAAMLVQ